VSSTEAYELEIETNRRWNFAVNVSDAVAVNLAKSFIFSSTILTLYASYLTSSAILIGLVPAIQQLGFMLPQLILAQRSESLARKKPLILKISITERLPYLFIALAIFLWSDSPSWFAYLMLAVNIAVATGSAGLGAPAWMGMLAKVIHPDRRGLLFSLGTGVGGLLGIGGAFLSRFILRTQAFPISFGFCFLLSFLAEALSYAFLAMNREPEKDPEIESRSFRQYVRTLPRLLKTSRNFSRYLASQFLIILGTMAANFYIIFGRYRFGTDDAFAATLTMVALVTQSVSTPALGWLSDRLGHKWLAEISSWLGIAAIVLMLFISNQTWLYPVFILMNLSVSAMTISRMCITMEFGKIENLPTFAALSFTLLAIPTMLAPILGGWILDLAGFTPLFVSALAISVAGWGVLRWGVEDPRMGPRRRSASMR
jgi:MFS family permease